MKNNYFKANDKSKSLTGSRKKRFGVYGSTSLSTASYWSDGSKSTFSVINRNTGASHYPPTGSYPSFQASYTIQPGEVVIETSIFCGKPGTPRFYCLPEEEAETLKWLGNPEADDRV